MACKVRGLAPLFEAEAAPIARNCVANHCDWLRSIIQSPEWQPATGSYVVDEIRQLGSAICLARWATER